MLYSIDNVTISMFLNLSTELRRIGWNVFWHASGETEAFTGGTEQGTVSLIQSIPENPTFITDASTGSYGDQSQIIVPAFAMKVQPPRKKQRLGLGDTRFEREYDVKIGGLAANARQQATLASTLYEWLDIGDTNYYMPMWDYSDPDSPTALDPAEVWWVDVTTQEVATEVDNIRYQINIQLVLRYVE